MTLRFPVAIVALCASCALAAGSATVQEDFASDPAARGWNVWGDAALFHWDGAAQNLQVTWDSSQPNSYFHHSLGTVLSRQDSFRVGFDLVLQDVTVGLDPENPFTFELAVGLMDFSSATDPNFFRGSGLDPTHGPRNVLELDYFPDSGFGATVSPTIVSDDVQYAFSFNYPLELGVGSLFHVDMSYTGSDQTLTTTMTRDGQPFGPIQDVVLDAGFSGFHLDTLAVMSYCDEGQGQIGFGGSILAHGSVDNLTFVLVPEPSINELLVIAVVILGLGARRRHLGQAETASDLAFRHPGPRQSRPLRTMPNEA